MNDSGRFIRIGPLSLFALIAILFLSTLAVLSITTANASYNLAQLQADGMDQQYEAESAAQTFLSLVDSRYSSATTSAERDATERANAARAAQAAANAAQASASDAADGTTGDAAATDAATDGAGDATGDASTQDTAAQDASALASAQEAREIAEYSARSAAGSISGSINQLALEAAASVDSRIAASAQIKGSTITAQFACPNGRVLDIEVELGSGGTFRIIKWNMTAKVNSAEPETLWIGM